MRDEIRSVFLVEGMFDENAKVSVQLLESGDTYERWEVVLSGTSDSSQYMVRYAPPENWQKISVKRAFVKGDFTQKDEIPPTNWKLSYTSYVRVTVAF